jgi:hypothetical protein
MSHDQIIFGTKRGPNCRFNDTFNMPTYRIRIVTYGRNNKTAVLTAHKTTPLHVHEYKLPNTSILFRMPVTAHGFP